MWQCGIEVDDTKQFHVFFAESIPVSFYSATLARHLPLFVRSDARQPPSLIL